LITTLFTSSAVKPPFVPSIITVISGSKHSTSLTHDGMCSGEKVIVATINGQRRNVGRDTRPFRILLFRPE
jgi:hypothetical protein